MVNPPTIAPACAAAERRHLGVWSACAAEGKCIAPNAHIVLKGRLRADARCSWSWIRVAFLPLRIDSALPLQLKCSWRIGMPTRSSLTIDRAGSSCHFIETKGQNNRFAFAPSAVKSGNWGQRASALSASRASVPAAQLPPFPLFD